MPPLIASIGRGGGGSCFAAAPSPNLAASCRFVTASTQFAEFWPDRAAWSRSLGGHRDLARDGRDVSSGSLHNSGDLIWRMRFRARRTSRRRWRNRPATCSFDHPCTPLPCYFTTMSSPAQQKFAGEEPGGTSLGPSSIRPLEITDHDAWMPLWKGYQAFYKVVIPDEVSRVTWGTAARPNGADARRARARPDRTRGWHSALDLCTAQPGRPGITATCKTFLSRPKRAVAALAGT